MIKRGNKQGFTLLELLVGIGVLVIIAVLGLVVISRVSQRTKAVAAQLTIAQHAMLLETVREDIGHYPDDEAAVDSGTLNVLTLAHSDLLTSPWDYQTYYSRWNGPYLTDEKILDPWKHPYFYVLNVEPDNLLQTAQLMRTSGPPTVYTYSFTSTAASGILIAINGVSPVSSASVKLNGVEVISEDELKHDVTKVEKTVTLNIGSNTLEATLKGSPGTWITVSINTSGNPFEEPTAYIMGSRGADGQPGGDGFDKDIVWMSGQSGGGF